MPLSSIARGRRFRELVSLALAVEGFRDARPRAATISDAISGDGDILGLPHNVVVRAGANSEGMDDLLREARKLADERGPEAVPVAILHRPSKSVSEAYAATDVAGLAVLLRALLAQQGQEALEARPNARGGD